MDVKLPDQAVQDTMTNIAAGGALTLLGAFVLWMRKLIGLPKRVRALESVNPIILQTLSAQNKILLASNQHRRESDKTPEFIHAETLLREADEQMDAHLRNSLTGGKS